MAYCPETSVGNTAIVQVLQTLSNTSTVAKKCQEADVKGIQQDGYQFQSPHILFAPQMLPEVKIHSLVDETEPWVYLRGVHAHKWYYAYILMVEQVAYVNFVAEPLRHLISTTSRRLLLQHTRKI